MKKTLQAYLLSRLEREPDGRAIAFLDDRGEQKWYSYSEFLGHASSDAAFLSRSGLRKGGICIVVLPSGEPAAKIVLACVLMGAAPLLIAPPSLQTAGAFSNLKQILQGMIRKIRPDLVILEDSLLAMANDINATADLRNLALITEGNIEPGKPEWARSGSTTETDLAALQLTSGTTGFPKVCSWQQARVIAALEGMADAMRLTREDICVNWTPLYHDMGLVNNFLLCLTMGIPLGMLKPQDFVKNPSLWLRALADLRATTTWSPNFGFAITAQRCKKEDLEGVDLGHVRAFWNAAERVHYDTMIAFHARFKSHGVRLEALKTNFGCAENVGGATFSDPDGPFAFERIERSAFLEQRVARLAKNADDQEAAVVVVGVGKPHSQMKIQILSDEGTPLPDGHIGEVALDSPSAMDGYLGDVEATDRALVAGLLRTGDLGYLRDGELFWVGRVQERMNVRGVKLDPSDFESILLNIQGLRAGSFAAFGSDDPVKGTQRIVIVTEVRSDNDRTGKDLTDDVQNQVFLTLGVSIDEVILVRDGTLTKTSSGKRRHRFIKELYENGQLTAHAWSPALEARPILD